MRLAIFKTNECVSMEKDSKMDGIVMGWAIKDKDNDSAECTHDSAESAKESVK